MTREKFLLLTEKGFEFIGFHVSDEGICIASNFFARMICELAVREGKFIKIEKGKYKVK